MGTDVEDRCRGSWCAQRGTWRASNGAGTRVFGRGAVPHARPVRVVRGDVKEEQAWPLRRFGAMRWRNGEAEAEQRREKVKKKGAQCPNRWVDLSVGGGDEWATRVVASWEVGRSGLLGVTVPVLENKHKSGKRFKFKLQFKPR